MTVRLVENVGVPAMSVQYVDKPVDYPDPARGEGIVWAPEIDCSSQPRHFKNPHSKVRHKNAGKNSMGVDKVEMSRDCAYPSDGVPVFGAGVIHRHRSVT